ncbi:AIPR family protein [Clostridium butyricum]|uniref:AIPR family protein n=1 Tax=Clostridium butyricum TaxID=1492 RepID=UPI00374E41EE
MSIVHVNQIKNYLKKEYSSLIDLDDQPKATPEQKENLFLTRALSAYAINTFVDVEKEEIVSYIVDGYDDNGIDAFYLDEDKDIFYLVQSKWHNDGSGTISKGDIQNFIVGIKDLFNGSFERFNKKVNKHKEYIEKAINSSNTKLKLIIVHTGVQKLGEQVARDLDDFIVELNSPTEVCTKAILTQGDIHICIANNSTKNCIDIDIMLNNWGFFNQPYKSYYGFADASQIAGWYEDYNPKIFAPNIRMFLGDSDVNKELEMTLKNNSEKFFYFNNGVTILCNSVEKTRAGGQSRDSGLFKCTGVSIVNGAQTVGTIGEVFQKNPEEVEGAYVLVKMISLQDCPQDFDREITKATNTQNKIESRDFVSQDMEQIRIQRELAIEDIHYSFKKGDVIEEKESGFTFEEAAVSLACSNTDISLATVAKSQVSRLWNDTSKAPYKTIFNNSLNGVMLWKLVRIQRMIDEKVIELSKTKLGREKMYLTHGNRFFAHCIYRKINIKEILRGDINSEIANDISLALEQIYSKTIDIINQNYKDSVLAYFFKNNTKCKDVEDKLINNKII